jgi:hypothetical protein
MRSNVLRVLRQEWDNYVRDRRRTATPDGDAGSRVLADIRHEGAHVVHGYWSGAQCARACAEMDRLLDVHRDAVWVDAMQSDHRLMGADRVSPIIAEFYRDAFCTSIVRSYEKSQSLSGFTLASKLVYRDGNPGSGGGWHRDRPDRRQTKAILYLSDVDGDRGPFQYFAGSHRPLSIIRNALRDGVEVDQSRFDDEHVAALIAARPGQLRTVTAPAGTLILVDTRAIHRGMPMTRDGVRYALTNYYWSDADIPEHIAERIVSPPAHAV